MYLFISDFFLAITIKQKEVLPYLPRPQEAQNLTIIIYTRCFICCGNQQEFRRVSGYPNEGL